MLLLGAVSLGPSPHQATVWSSYRESSGRESRYVRIPRSFWRPQVTFSSSQSGQARLHLRVAGVNLREYRLLVEVALVGEKERVLVGITSGGYASIPRLEGPIASVVASDGLGVLGPARLSVSRDRLTLAYDPVLTGGAEIATVDLRVLPLSVSLGKVFGGWQGVEDRNVFRREIPRGHTMRRSSVPFDRATAGH